MSEVGGIDADRLKSIVERIERLEEEKKALSSDINDIYLEAKSAGFDKKAVKHVVKQRAKARQEREEERIVFELYEKAVDLD